MGAGSSRQRPRPVTTVLTSVARLILGPLRADARDGLAGHVVELQHVAGVFEAARFALNDEGFHTLDEIPEEPLAFRVREKVAARTDFLASSETLERVLESP